MPEDLIPIQKSYLIVNLDVPHGNLDRLFNVELPEDPRIAVCTGIQLDPCPNCKDSELRIHSVSKFSKDQQAYCNECHMRGPSGENAVVAAELWNRLPRPVGRIIQVKN